MTHVLHIARINNVDSAMFCKHDSEIQFLKWTGLKWTSKHLSLSTKVVKVVKVVETRLEDENSPNDVGY